MAWSIGIEGGGEDVGVFAGLCEEELLDVVDECIAVLAEGDGAERDNTSYILLALLHMLKPYYFLREFFPHYVQHLVELKPPVDPFSFSTTSANPRSHIIS